MDGIIKMVSQAVYLIGIGALYFIVGWSGIWVIKLLQEIKKEIKLLRQDLK